MSRTNKMWSSEETSMILTYMHEKKEEGFEVEKPTADLYFTRMLTQIPIVATLVQVKNRIKYLKASFSSALEWLLNKIEAMRAEEEASLRKAELKLNIDKFEYEKEMQKELQLKEMKLKEAEMELKKARIESKERLKILEMEKDERLAVMKMKLEESKLRPHE